MSRYNDPSHVLNLPYDYGMEMIFKSRDKELERSAWELWLTLDGEGKKEQPFGEFLKKIKEPKAQNTDTRTDEEVIHDAEKIMKLMKRSE